MMVFLKLVVIVAMWIGTAMLSDKMGINPLVAPGMVLLNGTASRKPDSPAKRFFHFGWHRLTPWLSA